MTDSSTAGAAPPLSSGLRTKLSLMMFLQYAIWGAWLPLLYPFLMGHRGFSADQCGVILASGAVGAIVGPFLAGQLADRHFATERVLAVSHLAGAILVWFLATTDSFEVFVGMSLVYGLIYAPTLSLTNSLAFHHLPDRDRDFGQVRLWGTVGWIFAGIAMAQWLLMQHTPEGTEEVVLAAQNAGMTDAFRMAALLGFLMAAFCMFLPSTPPSQGQRSNATMEALGEIKRKPLLVLFLLAVPVSCIHQFYFVHTAQFLGKIQVGADGFVTFVNKIFGVGGGGLMTIGQMSEILVLAVIPFAAKSMSRRSLLAVGLAAYALRMWLFANVDAIGPAGLLIGIALHGLCFGCFIFVAFMVVDENTTGDVRASAQSLFNMVIIGVGIIVGSMIATSAVGWATTDGVLSYPALFSYPMYASIVCLAILILTYPRKNTRLRD
ncbi:MAG: MFS transporter [Planctomycetota bacterium]|nr:MFS transporter [Planctomycetota bacterium]MDG2142436.1 MFS transporter [Planctomycetota bacterium]